MGGGSRRSRAMSVGRHGMPAPAAVAGSSTTTPGHPSPSPARQPPGQGAPTRKGKGGGGVARRERVARVCELAGGWSGAGGAEGRGLPPVHRHRAAVARGLAEGQEVWAQPSHHPLRHLREGWVGAGVGGWREHRNRSPPAREERQQAAQAGRVRVRLGARPATAGHAAPTSVAVPVTKKAQRQSRKKKSAAAAASLASA